MHQMNWLNQSHCKSPYPSREGLTDPQRTSLATAYILLTPFTLVLNGFLIYALHKTKQYRQVFSRFILALSISDFFIGFLVQPISIYLLLAEEDQYGSCFMSWIFTFVAYALLNFSGLSIFIVSVDRFLRLRKLQRYAHAMTISKVNSVIIGTVLISIGISIGCIIASYYSFFCYYNMVVISINGLAAGGILLFYGMTWRNVRKRIISIRHLSPQDKGRSQPETTICCPGDDGIQESQRLSKLVKLSRSKLSLAVKRSRPSYDAAMTRTVAAILLCCCVTYPPYFVISFHRSLNLAINSKCGQKADDNIIWFFATFYLMFVNSTVNAILYSCHNRQVKELLVKMCSFRQQKADNIEVFKMSKNGPKAILVSTQRNPYKCTVNNFSNQPPT